MLKSLHRFTAFSLCFLLALNTATAGRWFRSVCEPTPCCPPVACAAACEPVCCGEVVWSSGCDSGCDDCDTGCDDCGSTVVQETPTPAPTTTYESAPIVPTPADTTPPAPTVVEEPMQEMLPQPNEFALDEPPAEAPLAEEPAAFDEPADDLFAAEPEPMDEPVDEPVDEPMAAEDDLFADEGFGEETSEDAFAMEPPAEEPAPVEEPMAEEDDLFGGFGDAEAVEPMDAAEDDLFGGTAEEPMAEEAAEDDLFGGFGDEPLEEALPVEQPEAPAEEAPDDEFEDLFGGLGVILREAGGYQSDQMRTWVDNSGSFSCVARLVAVDGGAVKLLKASGATSTVPLARLSQRDLMFVNRQAIAMLEVDTPRMAQR